MLEGAEEGECREEEMEGGQRGAACVVLEIFRGHQVHIHEEKRLFIKKKNLFSQVIFYIHCLRMQVHSKKYYSD